METPSRGSVDHGVVVKEEKRSVESNGDDPNIGKKVVNGIRKVHEEDDSSKQNPTDLGRTKQMPTTTSTRRSPALENNVSASTHKDLQDDDQLMESAKAEMVEVREENERLKTVLARIRKEYQSLQTQFFDIVQQEQQSYNKKSSTSTTSAGNTNEHEEEDPELISLSLGRSSSNSGDHQQPKRDHHEMMKTSTSWNKSKVVDHEEEFKHEGLSLALLSKTTGSANQVTSPENSLEGHEQMNKEDQDGVGEQWPPSEMLKIMKSTANTGDDEVSQQTAMKKARVSVRARCDTPTMNDGCQWRKYGQKIAKGNPCPRAYYRCTAAPACPVRKQVQRCAEDMSILITTYEGTHNHPLPISATAMASTTSAAASMLMSGSTISQPILTASATTTTTSAADLHGLNFSLTDNNSMQRQQFYLPNSSISSSPSYPTIILDLTAPPADSSSASQFNRLSSNFSTTPPRYSTTNFNFSSSSDLQPNNNTSTLPISWVNGYLSYGAQSYNKNQIGGALNLGRQPHQEHNFYQPNYLQRTTTAPQQTLTETIAAATKAITSDPSFRSALASAITSIVTGGGATVGNNAVVENILQNMKWGSSEPFPTINSTYSTSTTNANGCGSSYLNRSSSSNTQQGSLLFLPPSLPFTSTKSASTSPVDNRSHIN